MSRWSAVDADPLDRLGHDEHGGHRLARRRALGLEAREVQQVVDDARHAERLEVDPLGEPRGHRGITLDEEGLGKQAEGADRRLQLVAHVGDEVAADLLEAPALRDVLDHGEHTELAAPVVDERGADVERASRRAVEVDGPLGAATAPCLCEQLGDRLGGDRVAVAAGHELLGVLVAVHDRAGLVAQHEAHRERVEGASQADRLRARLGDGLGGRSGHLLEVAERGLDAAVVGGRVLRAESRTERGEPQGDRPPSRTAPHEVADREAHDDDDERGKDEHRGRPRGRIERAEHGPSMAEMCRGAAPCPTSCGLSRRRHHVRTAPARRRLAPSLAELAARRRDPPAAGERHGGLGAARLARRPRGGRTRLGARRRTRTTCTRRRRGDARCSPRARRRCSSVRRRSSSTSSSTRAGRCTDGARPRVPDPGHGGVLGGRPRRRERHRRVDRLGVLLRARVVVRLGGCLAARARGRRCSSARRRRRSRRRGSSRRSACLFEVAAPDRAARARRRRPARARARGAGRAVAHGRCSGSPSRSCSARPGRGSSGSRSAPPTSCPRCSPAGPGRRSPRRCTGSRSPSWRSPGLPGAVGRRRRGARHRRLARAVGRARRARRGDHDRNRRAAARPRRDAVAAGRRVGAAPGRDPRRAHRVEGRHRAGAVGRPRRRRAHRGRARDGAHGRCAAAARVVHALRRAAPRAPRRVGGHLAPRVDPPPGGYRSDAGAAPRGLARARRVRRHAGRRHRRGRLRSRRHAARGSTST